MKKLIISAALGLMVPFMSMGQSTFGPGTLTSSLIQSGSPHNFADQSWNPAVIVGGVYQQQGGQICQPCHTPHNAKTPYNMTIPLWNHVVTTASYTMYTKVGTTTALQGLTVPDGTSLLCLSCHDGSVALANFGGTTTGATFIGAGYTYIAGGNAANSGALLGTDLTNDHPISITWAGAATRPLSGFTSTYTSPGVYTASASSRLSSWLDNSGAVGKVQCTSCHGPHSNKYGYQLKVSNQGSALCLNCHQK